MPTKCRLVVPAARAQGHPMGRLLRPVDIAATVGHLLSDASAMMTSAVIDLHPETVRCLERGGIQVEAAGAVVLLLVEVIVEGKNCFAVRISSRVCC